MPAPRSMDALLAIASVMLAATAACGAASELAASDAADEDSRTHDEGVADSPSEAAAGDDFAVPDTTPDPGARDEGSADDGGSDQDADAQAPADLVFDPGAWDVASDPGTPDAPLDDAGLDELEPTSDAGGEDSADVAGAEPDAPPPALGSVSPAQLHQELEHKDFLLINVHIPDAGQIPGTDKHIAYDQVDQLVAFVGPDKTARVVLYCLSNYMSTIAGQQLVALGYSAVRYLDGGMSAWKAAGYPFES